MNIFFRIFHIRRERALALSSGRSRILLEYLICALSGAVYSTVFAGTDLYVLAWFGMVPLYWIVSSATPGRAFTLSLTWGYFCTLFSFMWLREIMFFIPFIFGFVLGMFPALWGMVLPFLYKNFMIPASVRLEGPEAVAAYRNRNPFREIAYCCALAAWWCVTEWIRSWIFTGLPWNLVGSSQWQMLPLIQLCRYTGVYGVSFLVVLVNISLGFFLKQLCYAKNLKDGALHAYSLLFSLALIYMCVMFAGVKNIRRYQRTEAEMKSRIGVVQPNLSQRRSGGESPTLEAIHRCVDLSEKLLRENTGSEAPQILVWPETAVPVPYNAAYDLSGIFRQKAGMLTLQSKLPLLTGSIFLERSEKDPQMVNVYNSALLLQNGGRVMGRYDKVHIVPFGEYVPFGDQFPFLNQWLGMGRNLTPGKEFLPMEILPGLYAGINICYEDIFPYISRAHAKRGANALLVVTNDAWYPSSNEPVQHFANSIFRAVETGLPMIRIGNCNYSAVIAPTGRILSSVFRKQNSASWDPGRFEQGCAVLTLPAEKNPALTFYTRYGDLFIGVCIFYCIIILAAALVNCRTYHKVFADIFEKTSV